ncbi:MAG: rhodanese-like domain-containing protein, partial [Verrucomicrobiota bacterium]|nr:rhodanese-like domain-containing protein [Verrucomicrobiota bacterium]
MSTPARWKKPVLFTGGVLLIVALGFWLWLPSNGLNAARKFIPWKFGNVTHTTPEELNSWLKDSNRTAPRLWDIRRPDEFAVSHLPNARHVPPETSDSELKEILKDTDQPIVVYCAVGYR